MHYCLHTDIEFNLHSSVKQSRLTDFDLRSRSQISPVFKTKKD